MDSKWRKRRRTGSRGRKEKRQRRPKQRGTTPRWVACASVHVQRPFSWDKKEERHACPGMGKAAGLWYSTAAEGRKTVPVLSRLAALHSRDLSGDV